MLDALVIGGGLAGSAAAISLAQQGLQVRLLEKKDYPTRKLCGEFLSVEVGRTLETLGCLEAVRKAGANAVTRYCITAPDGRSHSGPLPGVALGFSRDKLDALLAARARSVGVDVRTRAAARAVEGGLGEGFRVTTGAGETVEARVVVGAYGRRDALDRKLGRRFLAADEPLVAFKGHFHGPGTADVIETHAFPGGYCGLVEVEGGAVNACWIAHRDALRASGGSAEGMLRGALSQNPLLKRRLDALEPAWGEFVAVSQVGLRPREQFVRDVCLVGDAAGMIAPLCGDGMAMALHAGMLAAAHLGRYLAGEATAERLRSGYAAAWRRQFRTRLALGRLLHWGYVQPRVAAAAVAAFRAAPPLADWVVRRTRG